MTDDEKTQTVPALLSDPQGRSVWVERAWPVESRGGMLLSPRIGCSSLRLRKSEPGYSTDWHVSGEPVLIIVRRGTLRIGLQDGSVKDFAAGDVFIAADRLPPGQCFDPTLHGHRAEVVGGLTLEAVHIKLDGFDG